LEKTDPVMVKVSSEHKSDSVILAPLDMEKGSKKNGGNSDKEVKKKKQSKALQDTETAKLTESKTDKSLKKQGYWDSKEAEQL
jgi:hypothetical protein